MFSVWRPAAQISQYINWIALSILRRRKSSSSKIPQRTIWGKYFHIMKQRYDFWKFQLFADSLIGFGVHRLVHLAARYTRVYYYRFSYEGRNSHIYYPNVTPYGVVHHDDLLYLFVEPTVSRMYNSNDEEFQTIETMTRMWTAFAYKGWV